VIRPMSVWGVRTRLLWAICFCLWVSIRVWTCIDRVIREFQPTFEVAGAIVCSIVFSTRGIIPLDSKPFAVLVCDGTDITNGTCLAF
jgi:hypothetical protein